MVTQVAAFVNALPSVREVSVNRPVAITASELVTMSVKETPSGMADADSINAIVAAMRSVKPTTEVTLTRYGSTDSETVQFVRTYGKDAAATIVTSVGILPIAALTSVTFPVAVKSMDALHNAVTKAAKAVKSAEDALRAIALSPNGDTAQERILHARTTVAAQDTLDAAKSKLDKANATLATRTA